MLTTSQKQHGATSSTCFRISELYEQLHFNQLCLHDHQSAKSAAELAFSPETVGKRLKRLRLRPTPPTPGEKNLRLHWQRNSGRCNVMMNPQRQTTSAPATSRATSKLSVTTSNLNLQTCNILKEVPRRPATTSTSRVKNLWPMNIDKPAEAATTVPSLRSKRISRSPTIADTLRSHGQIQSAVGIPTTPSNSPDCGFKIIRVTSKWRNSEISETLNNSNENEEDQNVVGQSNDGTVSDVCYNETRARLKIDVTTKKTLKKCDSLCQVNFSRQLMDRKRSDLSSGGTDWMKIQSFHPNSEAKPNQQSCKISSVDHEEMKDKPRQCTVERHKTEQFYEKQNEGRHQEANTEASVLHIKHVQAHFDADPSFCHKPTTKVSPKVVQPQFGSKAQIRVKRPFHQEKQHQRKKACFGEGYLKYCDISTLEGRRPVAPNPSLVDFGRKSVCTNPENETRSCNLHGTDQDPAVMLRILAWLENVESNPNYYYGFDAEKLPQD